MARISLLSPREHPVSAQICHTRPGSLVGYWPLQEPAGATKAFDIGGRCKATGTVLGALSGKVGGFGRRAYYFDGTSDNIDVYNATLAAAFNALEGTLLCFFRMSEAALLETTSRTLVNFGADASTNIARIFHPNVANMMKLTYTAAGTDDNSSPTGVKNTMGQMASLTWSKSGEVVRGYMNGVQWGPKSVTLGVWSGALGATRCCIGSSVIGAGAGFIGYMWDVALWRAPLTPGEIWDIWKAARSMDRR